MDTLLATQARIIDPKAVSSSSSSAQSNRDLVAKMLPAGKKISAKVLQILPDQAQGNTTRIKLEINNSQLLISAKFPGLPPDPKAIINIQRSENGQIQLQISNQSALKTNPIAAKNNSTLTLTDNLANRTPAQLIGNSNLAANSAKTSPDALLNQSSASNRTLQAAVTINASGRLLASIETLLPKGLTIEAKVISQQTASGANPERVASSTRGGARLIHSNPLNNVPQIFQVDPQKKPKNITHQAPSSQQAANPLTTTPALSANATAALATSANTLLAPAATNMLGAATSRAQQHLSHGVYRHSSTVQNTSNISNSTLTNPSASATTAALANPNPLTQGMMQVPTTNLSSATAQATHASQPAPVTQTTAGGQTPPSTSQPSNVIQGTPAAQRAAAKTAGGQTPPSTSQTSNLIQGTPAAQTTAANTAGGQTPPSTSQPSNVIQSTPAAQTTAANTAGGQTPPSTSQPSNVIQSSPAAQTTSASPATGQVPTNITRYSQISNLAQGTATAQPAKHLLHSPQTLNLANSPPAASSVTNTANTSSTAASLNTGMTNSLSASTFLSTGTTAVPQNAQLSALPSPTAALKIAVAGQIVSLQTPANLPPLQQVQITRTQGEQANIQWQQPAPTATTAPNTISLTATQSQLVDQQLRKVMPQQIPIAEGINQLMNQSGQLAQSVNPSNINSQIDRVSLSIMQMFGVKPGNRNSSDTVKRNIQQGGLFAESKLANHEGTGQGDMKNFLAKLSQLANQLPTEQRDILNTTTERMLARVTSNQLTHLQQQHARIDPSNERSFQIDIPVVHKEQLDNVEIEIKQRKHLNQQGNYTSIWSVRMHFELQERGEVDAEVALDPTDNSLSTTFLCTHASTVREIEQRMQDFRKQLSTQGFEIQTLHCTQGSQAANANNPIHKRIIDIRT